MKLTNYEKSILYYSLENNTIRLLNEMQRDLADKKLEFVLQKLDIAKEQIILHDKLTKDKWFLS